MTQDSSISSWNILKDPFLWSPQRTQSLRLTLQVSMDPRQMGVVIILKKKLASCLGCPFVIRCWLTPHSP
jgi:hypothetical protein